MAVTILPAPTMRGRVPPPFAYLPTYHKSRQMPQAVSAKRVEEAIRRVTAAWGPKFEAAGLGEAGLKRLASSLRLRLKTRNGQPGFVLRRELREWEQGPMRRALGYEAQRLRTLGSMRQALRNYEARKIVGYIRRGGKTIPIRFGLKALRKRLRDLIERGHRTAALVGAARAEGTTTRRASLSDDDAAALEETLREEWDFLEGFLQELKQARASKQAFGARALWRIGLYARKFNATEQAAYVRRVPATANIYWRLWPPAEHCPDCPTLARRSPYTRATLPTVPGAGDTRCKTNCMCFLEVA